MEPNYQEAKNSAEELLKQYDIKEPVVPIFDIAIKEGIELKFVKMPEQLKNVAGFIDSVKKMMFVNKEDSPNRQTFTVAHELAHHILKHETDKYEILLRMTTSIEKNPLEKEANCFAANILVPYKMLSKIMRKYSLSRFDIKALAKIFGVSEELMRYRLQSTKYDC